MKHFVVGDNTNNGGKITAYIQHHMELVLDEGIDFIRKNPAEING